jgi:hypothetical protein
MLLAFGFILALGTPFLIVLGLGSAGIAGGALLALEVFVGGLFALAGGFFFL